MTSSSAIALVTIISIVVGTYQVYRAAKSTERQLYDIGLDHGHECIIRSPGLDFRRSDHYCHTHQCSRRHAVGTPRSTNHELLEVPRHPECSYDKRWTSLIVTSKTLFRGPCAHQEWGTKSLNL